MTSDVPKKIGFYSLQADGMRKVAVYSRTDDGITLDILDDRWERMARDYLTDGILHQRLGAVVTADHPDLFMEALLEPRNMTYYDFRPEP
ncbi:hypothetical protein [Glycomyces artemisiae]|uniref:Uncharacterized protein n=1 Tax=Glycomyces artemisiae TaxID=1076443 RepID=A0A2T0UM81_9ACTN|nr:hypothetical protein [Glycomyces artemisiae]PRY59043.1 hypothetical protein B0I28_104199 [Glycomyces artemisiae]